MLWFCIRAKPMNPMEIAGRKIELGIKNKATKL
jgi:hypothetical protein